MDIIKKSSFIWHPFGPLQSAEPIKVKKAKGVYLYTEDNRKIIDAISSWWVNIHGHAQPDIAKAIAKQARKLEQVIFAGFTHKPAEKLGKNLKKLLPERMGKIFFSDDGSTSTEVAIKLAIQYWRNQGIKRHRIIAIEGAYHGDTFGAMSVGSRNIFSDPWADMLFDVSFIPFPEGNGENAIRAMKELADDTTAAFIYEPLVQGSAGMRMYTSEVLEKLLEVAQSKKIVCIADEVMTGFGRTGTLFASDQCMLKPDLMCLSKGLTGGFLPMGITAVNERIVEEFDSADYEKTFFHGHSYTANPLACAAANASYKLLTSSHTQSQIDMISKCHKESIERINKYRLVDNVGSTGTILRIELKAEDSGYTSSLRDEIYSYFLSKDILLRPLGNIIYILPPFIIKKMELELIYNSIEEFLDKYER